MTMSMHILSAGEGVKYLLSSVVAGEGVRDASDALIRYYREKGTPPGRWYGNDLGAFGDGSLRVGDPVHEHQLRLLLGHACDPLTAQPLGRRFANYETPANAMREQTPRLPGALQLMDKADAMSEIADKAAAKRSQNAVAGFDHTFSVPKSVSALWAISDAGTQGMVARAHHAAMQEVLGMLERDVAATRVGADAGNGSVRQVEVSGVVATGYDHYDSRASDPQLHTHLVIANRVRSAEDPTKWRTLDSRPIHAAVVALSEHYNGVLADHIARDLGLAWERRGRGTGRNPGYELAAVPDELIAEFSSRSHDIQAEFDRLVQAWRTDHGGREPSPRRLLRLRQKATLTTRPDKTLHSLAELTEQWRSRATRVLGADATDWASSVLRGTRRQVLLRADDISTAELEELGASVAQAVGQKRSTWRRWNLYAEAARQLIDQRFASTTDRETVMAIVVDAAERASVSITPGEVAFVPADFRRADGSSEFRMKHGAIYTSQQNLDAEARILALAMDTAGPTAALSSIERATRKRRDGVVLSHDQARAVEQIAVSGRRVDVLVGPAGSGKTSTLAAIRAAWEQEHGKGTVVGLAPTAAAAQVLAEELGIPTENTAKWATEHDLGRWNFVAGQLVIVDEASLSGTFLLDRLTEHAAAVGAKVLLVGDRQQHGAVDASGVFGFVADSIQNRPELTEIWRFRHDWERQASLRLRLGEGAVVDEYDQQGRVAGGEHDAMLDAAYSGWLSDLAHRQTSLMIAETNEAVRALNLRARLDRIEAGLVDDARGVRLHDGTEAGAGDIVVTRQNDRRIRHGRTWVKNGDLWTVVAAHADGSIDIRPIGAEHGSIRLHAAYVAEQLELAYAITAYRAQGMTVDTAHAVVASTSMTRESLYVAMTRGRESNRVYVATDQSALEEHQQQSAGVSATSILRGILVHRGAELSAHEMIREEQETWTNIAQLAAEYDTIAQAAQRDRWVGMLRRVGLNDATVEEIASDDAFGPLAAELRRAEANHHDVELLLRTAIAERSLDDAEDVAAVLRYRVQRLADRPADPRRRYEPKLIVGIIPVADGIDDTELQRALVERAELIAQRAAALVDTAMADDAPWLRELGRIPSGLAVDRWRAQALIVAAYRDRWRIAGDVTLGGEPDSTNQRIDRARAEAAAHRARAIAQPEGRTRRGADRTVGRTL
ncbi:MAG: MobF family relaxase [Microbacteriaceae bacterium]